ncbi:MAG: 3-phosphoshikimate 1-carboxyvinyltransferase [Treponema sp.]|nr:3-phosphoshikimate 1-carboxyvinyltransferase [Candidatus Treponema caballi]
MSKVSCSHHTLSGTIVVPGSKSHTIRALLLATLADGVSYVENPLPSEDCLSAARAARAFGAEVDIGCAVDASGKPLGTPASVWKVTGARSNLRIPDSPVDVGNSGSTLYFFAPVAAALVSRLGGSVTFTGDESICTRPVNHLLDALRQLGAVAETTRKGINAPPFVISKGISAGHIVTDGRLSQYISGFMMASPLMEGELTMELTDPKETPYLTMTQQWLASAGVKTEISDDYRHISARGPATVQAKRSVIPSDWEGVAFPLIAALLSHSDITVDGIDVSGSQGDAAVVDVLRAFGAALSIDKADGAVAGSLSVAGSKTARLAVKADAASDSTGFLKADGTVCRIPVSAFPDAICALAVIACFVEGTVVLDDTGVCRSKETDRVQAMQNELRKLGADVTDGLSLPEDNPLHGDCLIIRGHSPSLEDGSANPAFCLHGGEVESYGDHRIAMSLACLGLGLPSGEVSVRNPECCAVSFPGFFTKMNELGAQFLIH